MAQIYVEFLHKSPLITLKLRKSKTKNHQNHTQSSIVEHRRKGNLFFFYQSITFGLEAAIGSF